VVVVIFFVVDDVVIVVSFSFSVGIVIIAFLFSSKVVKIFKASPLAKIVSFLLFKEFSYELIA
jgi:hypothetical protein